MAAYSLKLLSGSTNGKGIKVTGTATGASVTVHTAVAGTSSIDEITLWAVNNASDGSTRTLTIEFGGVTSPDNLIIAPVPCKVGPVMICDRLPLQNGLVVKAWADVANDAQIYGTVYGVV